MAEPPSLLIGSGDFPVSLGACNWLREGQELGRGAQRAGDGDGALTLPGLSQTLSHEKREGRGTNVRVNMRPHVGVEAPFGPLLVSSTDQRM